jgi:hypothetical protein
MALYAELFDGTRLEFPDNTDPAVIDRVAREETAKRQPKGESGFLPAAKATIQSTLGGAALLGGKLGLLSPEEAQQKFEAREAEARRIFAPTENWSDGAFTKFKELLGGSVPLMVAPLAAAGAAAALPLTGPAAVAAGLGAAGLASATQFTMSNLSRQMETAKSLDEASLGAAAVAAAPQALLDVFAFRAYPLIKQLFTSVGKEITEEAAQNLAKQGITNTIKDYAVTTGKTAGVEGLTESGQSFLERLQAGLNIADPSARAEYLDSFIGGAVLGGALAPVGRYIERQKQVEEPLAPGQRPGESLEQTAQRLNFDIKQMTAPAEKSPFLSSTELASMAAEENGYGKLVQYAERIKQEPDSPEKQASLEAAIELRKRVVSEAEARQTPTDKPYPFAEEPEKPIYLTGTGLIDLVNTKETPKDQLVSLLEYISKTKKDPESPERDQSIEQARTLYNLLQEEAKSRGFDLPEAFTLRAADLRAAGIPRTDPVYDQVKDKDLNKPDEADFVVKTLEAAQKRATPDLYDKLEGVLDSIDRYLESRPGSGFYAQRTYPQPSGEGVAVAGRRAGEQPPAEGLAPSERGGVAPVTEPVEQPVPTTKVKPAPLKVAKPVPVPKPAPSTELIPTTVAPTAPVATTALSEQRALVPLNLSNMSLEQLEKAREDADTNNLKLDLAAIRKYLGEDAAKKYEGLSRRARESWWDKNATTELENESSVFRGVDETLIDEYIQAFNNFDTTSPKDLGRSIALLVRDIDKPNFIGSPSYVTLRNAVTYAKQQGWKEEEVTGAMRQRASEWAGADAKELFKNLFATTKKIANEPIVIDVEARVVEETTAPQIALLPQPDVATLEKHYGSKSNTAEFLQKVKNDVVLFATKGSNAVAAAIRSIIKKIHAGVLSVALIFNPGSINFPESYVVVPKVPAAATEVVETPSKQTVIELATVPDNVEGMSDAAKQAYETLIPSLKDKIGDKLIVIADKPGARVFVFKPDGTLVTQNKALFGAAKGDLYKGNVDVPANRVTPAGLFGLKLIDAAKGGSAKVTAGEYDFGKVFALNDPEAVITIMHSVWLKDADASRRKAALANQNITDSRYSYGCINVDRDTYKFLLDNYESQMDGAKLFVVPDNQEQVKEFLAGKISQNLGGAKAGEGPDRLVRESVKKSLAKVAPQVSEAKFKQLEKQAKTAKEPEAKPSEARAPELQEKIDQLQGVLSKILAKYGLKDVKINLEEGMADEGSYSGQLIKLALDLDNPVRTLRHEAIHALKELGFFTPQQWKVLTDRAQKEWIEKYLKGQKAVVDGKEMTRYDAYMQLYDGDMEAIVEESIADAFADFSKTQPPAGMMRAILNRMQNLFKAIKQAMNVGGYDTAEDVFGAVEKGELPAPPSAPVAKGAKPSLRKWYDEGTPRQQDELDNLPEINDFNGMEFIPVKGLVNSANSTYEDFELAPGVREVPLETEFVEANKRLYAQKSEQEYISSLAQKISANQKIEPLIVALEPDGETWVLEGQHRIRALSQLGYKSFPARVVVSMEGDRKDYELPLLKREEPKTDYKKVEGQLTLFSLRAPKTEQFKKWFGDSKITDDNGEPLVVYHGTKADITAFDTDAEELRGTTTELDILSPMGSHFSKDPQVANNFAKQTGSAVYPVFLRILNPKVYKKEQDLRDELIQQSLNNRDVNDVLENPDAYLNYAEGDLKQDADPEVRYNLYDGDPKYRQIVNQAALNNLRDTADPEAVAGFLKDMAYAWKSANPSVDGVIYENGAANEVRGAKSPTSYIAFAPNQIKSTTGNYGEYGLESADIRKSLRPLPTLSSDVTDRVKATIVPRYRAGYVERILDAISPKQFSKFRKEFINRYDIQAKFDREAARQIKLMGGKEQLADAKAEPAALFADLGGGLAAAAMGVNDRKGGIPVYVKKYVVEKDFLELSTHNTKAAADAAAKKVPGAKVYEQGYTKVMDKAEGLLPIFQQLATYAKPKLGEPDAYSQYQFWADVKRTSKYILNPGTGKYEEKLFTQDDIKRANQIEKAFPEFVEIQKKWIAYNNGLVDFMRDTGVVSEAGAKEMKKHGDYFPLYRHLGEDDIQGPRLFTSIANVQGPKAAKGSESEVTDFFETIVRNTQSAIQAGIKNIAARRATDQAMRIGEVVKLNRPQSGPTVYRVLEDGKETYYQTRDPMFIESLKSLYQPDIPFIGLLSTPARILRNLVTKDPAFQLANMMRDSLSAYVASGFKFTPIVATLKQYAKAIADKSPEMRELRSAGVIGGYDYSQGVETSARKLEAEIRKAAKARTTMEKLTSPATSLWGALEKSSEASDSATRQEIYKKVLEQTGNEAEALYQALEIMNFNRKGRSPIIRILTAAVPFMNARIQGLDVLYRSGMRPISGDATEAEKKRMNTFWVRGMTLMALSGMYWLLTHDDEEYKAQEQETRDNYWLFPSAGVKIPIPFEIGVMFKVIPERILEYAFGSDTGKDFLKSMERQVVSTFAFNLIPQTFLPAYEVKTNYSFFTQRPVISPGMENISPEYQVGPNTSKVSGAIGQALNISPIKLDYLIQGYTGTMGMYAVNLFDAFFSMNDEAPKASRRLEQMPVLRRFMVDPEARGSISAYYDLKNSVDEVVRTSNFLQRSMDFENYGKYMQENVQMLAVKDYINDLEKTMKEYREMKNLVRISNMDADSKRDTLSNIGKLEQQLTKNIQTLKKQIASQ